MLDLRDYKYKDNRWYRLDDAFAELRIIILLDQYGFSNIQLLKANNNIKQVDIIAYYQDKLFTIDVAHSKTGYFDKKRFESIEKIVSYINNIYIKKKGQLKQSLAVYNADEIMIAVVIDEINRIIALNYSLREIASRIYLKTNFNKECGLVLLFNDEGYVFMSKEQDGGTINGNTIT